MTQTLKTSERLGVVDALRGFALLAIVLLHNLEHYNLFLVPDDLSGGCVCFSCLRSYMPYSITGIFFYSMR